MLDEKETLFEELREKVSKIEAALEEIQEESGEDTTPDEDYLQVTKASSQFFIHWIDPSETSFSCSDVDSVKKAQQAFKEAVEYRDDINNDKREVLHGDVMVLLCNTAEESDEETGEVTYPDSCYYVGMCVVTDGIAQIENPNTNIEISDKIVIEDSVVKQVIAWDTCGGDSCPEDPETIKIDEIVIPDDSGSGDDVSCLTYLSSGSSLTAKLNEIKSLQIDESSSGSSVSDDNHVIHDAMEFTNKGLLVDTQEILVGPKDYNLTAEVDEVSLFSQSAVLQQSNYKAATIESAKVSISSDSCGNLKKSALESSEDSKEISVLAKQEGASGSTLDISALNIIKTPDTVLELGTTTLNTAELGTENPFTGKFFMPEITAAEMGTIEPDLTIPTVSNLSLSVETSGDDCKTITFTLTGDTKDLIFASGVLVNTQDSSPLNIVKQITVAGCGVMCGDCPGIVESDIPFTRIKEYQYLSNNQSICPNNPDNLIINNNCWTFIRDVEYSWVIQDGCSAIANSTLISGQFFDDNIELTQSFASPCEKLIWIRQINSSSFDLSTFPTDEYYNGIASKENPNSGDFLYIFS